MGFLAGRVCLSPRPTGASHHCGRKPGTFGGQPAGHAAAAVLEACLAGWLAGWLGSCLWVVAEASNVVGFWGWSAACRGWRGGVGMGLLLACLHGTPLLAAMHLTLMNLAWPDD